MKKQQILFLIFGIFFLFACNKKTAEKTQTTETTGQETAAEEEEVVIEEDVTEVPPPAPYIMASIKKTPCYGTCPVYDFKIYNSGEARYNGKMYVDRVGKYAAHLDKATVKSIKDKAMEVNYFDFYSEYPTSDIQIADLPTTVTYFRIGDMEKTVLNKMQAPDALKEYEKFLIKLIEKIEWTKMED